MYIVSLFCITESQIYELVASESVQIYATDSRIVSDALVMADGGRTISNTLVVPVPTSMSESEQYSKKTGRHSCNAFY